MKTVAAAQRSQESPSLSQDRSTDRQAFQRLYRSAYGFVRQRARQLLRDEEAALDATQEAFARAWERWSQVAEARSQVGWLLVAATRICIDRLRHRSMARAHLDPLPVSLPPNGTGHLARLLNLRLGQEKPLRQQVVVHVWVDGMTQEETAALLGISRKTVQRQLDAFRAKHASELAALAEVHHD